MRRTWRLRPSWIVNSITFPRTRRTQRGRRRSVVELHAAAQARRAPPRPLARRRASRAVDLCHSEARVGQAVGELAVVREQDQAAAVGVQPSDRVQPQPRRRHQRDHGRAPVRVARRGEDAGRLVDGVHDPRLGAAQRMAVELTRLCSPTSRAGSVTTSPPTRTRPAAISVSAERREAAPAWARYLARRIQMQRLHDPRPLGWPAWARRLPRTAGLDNGSSAARPDARRPRASRAFAPARSGHGRPGARPATRR